LRWSLKSWASNATGTSQTRGHPSSLVAVLHLGSALSTMIQDFVAQNTRSGDRSVCLIIGSWHIFMLLLLAKIGQRLSFATSKFGCRSSSLGRRTWAFDSDLVILTCLASFVLILDCSLATCFSFWIVRELRNATGCLLASALVQPKDWQQYPGRKEEKENMLFSVLDECCLAQACFP